MSAFKPIPIAALDRELDALLKRIEENPATRLQEQPRLHQLLKSMRECGRPIPLELLALDRRLVDEAVEDMFDNLPI